MEQWSEIEFHDEEHVPSNISQLARLYQESGLSAGAFQAKMFEARKITLKHRPKNFAAYFFSVLRDLLGVNRETASSFP
jgi:hypothetical protein